MCRIPFLRLSISIVLAMLSMGTGCAPYKQAPAPTTTPPTPAWIVKWLEDPACYPPCWENIRPGVSTVDSVQAILSQYSPNVGISTVQGSSVIRTVRLAFGLDNNLPLSLLISKYGSPDYVRIYLCDESGNCDTHAIFTKIGMVLTLYLPEIGEIYLKDRVAISSDARVTDIYFLEAGLDKYYESYSPDAHQLTAWSGYKEYP
jgi:hypothetical protein